MTTANWWWTQQKDREIEVSPPSLVDPGPQTYYLGESIDLQIHNTGGPVATWNVGDLPVGLSVTEQTPYFCRITGFAGGIQAPVLVDPGDQTWYPTKDIDILVNNTGGPVDSWTYGPFPIATIQVTEETPTYIRIQNLVSSPLPPLDTTFFTEYLNRQHGVGGSSYIGHGPTAVDTWNYIQANDELPPGFSINGNVYYYDYARVAMAAYNWFALRGTVDPRWVTYGDASARFWDWWYIRNSYRPQGYHFFSGGYSVMEQHDPGTYSWCRSQLLLNLQNSTYAEIVTTDTSREASVREIAYYQLGYFDYLWDRPSDDPMWSSSYRLRREHCIDHCQQWLYECNKYLQDNEEYLSAVSPDRDPTNPNLVNHCLLMNGIWIETIFRMWATDETGEIDKDWLVQLARAIMLLSDQYGQTLQGNYFERWYGYVSPASQPPEGCGYVRPIDDVSGNKWCDRRIGSPNLIWNCWRLAQHGYMFAMTGDRQWVTRGDVYWNNAWGSSALYPFADTAQGAGQKNNVEILRYSFDYLRYRNSEDFETQFGFTTASKIPVPPLTTDDRPTYPTVDSRPVQNIRTQAVHTLGLTATPGPITEWSSLNLPPGLNLSQSGQISGVPLESHLNSSVFAKNADGFGYETVIEYKVTNAVWDTTPGIFGRYDFADKSTMWQDMAGTQRASVDLPVARVDDLSGNGNHLLQATDANRPILASVADGTGYALSFSGSQTLSVAFTESAQPNTVLAVLEDTDGTVANQRAYSSVVGGTARHELRLGGGGNYVMATSLASLNSNIVSDTSLHILDAQFSDVSSVLYVDGVPGTVGNPGTEGCDGFTVGGDNTGANQFNGRYRYLLINDGTFTATQRNQIGRYLSSRHGTSWTDSPGGAPFIDDPGPRTLVVDVYFELQLTASPAATSWDDGGSLPPGLSIDDSGLISGTPTTASGRTFATITATNANGTSPNLIVTLEVYQAFSWSNYPVIGVIYDFTDLTSMWQDTSGTIPAIVGNTVERVDDLSGNGRHLTALTSPTAPTAVAVSDGNGVALQFNGTNNRIRSADFSSEINQPIEVFLDTTFDRAINTQERAFSSTTASFILGKDSVFFSYAGVYVRGRARDTDQHIFTAEYNTTASTLWIDGGDADGTGDVGSLGLAGINIGSSAIGSNFAGMTARHFAFNAGTLSINDRNDIGRYFAARQWRYWETIPGGVVEIPVINDPGAQTGEVGVAFSLQMTASNSPTSWDATDLPPGLDIDDTGLISGTPTADGFYAASITATNDAGTSSPLLVSFSISPAGVPGITPIAPRYDEVGVAITPFTPTSSGQIDTWSLVNQPTGITINSSTGEISGTPTIRSFQTATVTATGPGGSDNTDIDWTVHGAATDAPDVQDPGNQTVNVGVPYTLYVRNIGGPVTTWDVRVGWLPSGLNVVDDTQPYYLEIGGTPD